MHRALEGGHVQRVTVAQLAGQDVALMVVRVPGETRHVVAMQGRGVAVVPAELLARLREALRAGVPRDKSRWPSVVEAAGDRDATPEAIASLLDREVDARRDALRRAVARAVARVDRRIEAVQGDLARAEGADDLARKAQLFVAAASSAQRGAREIVTVDYASGEPRDVRLALDPSRPARAQIDGMFQRARRLKEGARIGRDRLADARLVRERLDAVARAADDPAADVAALEARARAAAPRDYRGVAAGAPSGHKTQERAAAFRTFTASLDRRVLVGKGGERNDELTFHVARPHDLWLHAKGRTGAHVVVPLPRGTSCPAELLVDAAHLAAHFSEAREEGVVEVQYVERRHLRKPRGTPPGFVVVQREKVLVLRREEAVLRRLLDAEVAG